MQPLYAPPRYSQSQSTSPPWQEQQMPQDGPVESTLTRRRREANRLAAQRFRSRKKGYQDLLEERVRNLESEKQTLEDRLQAVSKIPVTSPLDVKTAGHAFDIAAHEANKELRLENAKLRLELEDSRREAKQWKDEVTSAGYHTARSSTSSIHPPPSTRSEPYKRRRTSEEAMVSSPQEVTPPYQLPTPSEYPFHPVRVTPRPSLSLDLKSPSLANPRTHPLPSPSMFLTPHASSENFKLAPLRLPPSPKLMSYPSLPSPNLPSPRNGFEILLAVGQEISKSPKVGGEELKVACVSARRGM